MKFRITPHAGFTGSKGPANAMDLLWQGLDSGHDEASFRKVGDEIRATWGEDGPASVERDLERAEVGRRAILNIVIAVCERTPELNSDWFAVSAEP